MPDIIDNANDINENVPDNNDEMDYKKWYDDNKEKIAKVDNVDAIISKNRELLNKMAKTKEERDSLNKRLDEQNGNWEKLYKDQQAKIRDKTVDNLAKELGLKYGADDDAQTALTLLLEKRVKEIVNEEGDFDINDVETLKKDIETNKLYVRLLGERNKGTGSGAQGNIKTNMHSLDMKRVEFDKLPFDKQNEFINKVIKGQAKLED